MESGWTPQIHIFEGHADLVRSVAFSKADDLVISSTNDEVKVWEVATELERRCLQLLTVRFSEAMQLTMTENEWQLVWTRGRWQSTTC